MRSGFYYKCKSGETFDSVALQLFGDEKYARDLYGVNPKLCSVTVFEGGETLYLPVMRALENEPIQYAKANAPWR